MKKITYGFMVYITAEEATDDDGFTPQEVERLLKTTLNHYSGPLNKERLSLSVDYELVSTTDVPDVVYVEVPVVR
jgi:hypothetical protein